MKELSYDILIKLASEIASKEKEENAKLPYIANTLDDIRIGENAHSRILTRLLNYAGYDNSYPIYRIFLDLLKNKCCPVRNITIHNPNIKPEKERIDILIDERPSYSIIIENKVCWADDQPKQIERYIKKVLNHNVPKERIFVIYLTKRGTKKVTDISLTAQAKELLDYDDKKSCRFIELNYKDDLLPMFELAVLQIDRDKEPLLYSSLVQYTDYMKGQLSERVGEQEIIQKMSNYMADKLNVNSVQDCLEVYSKWKSLKKALDKKQGEFMDLVLNEKFIEPLKKYLGIEYECECKCEYKCENDELPFFHIIVKHSTWKNANIFIGEDEDGGVLIGVYGSTFTKTATQILQNAGYIEDIVNRKEKGYYKNIIKECVNTSDFWNLVDNGNFLKEAKKYVKEILTLLEGRNL